MEYGFTVIEYEPDRPWVVKGSEHRTVDLSDGQDFFAWALERWPAARFRVEQDPEPLGEWSKRP